MVSVSSLTPAHCPPHFLSPALFVLMNWVSMPPGTNTRVDIYLFTCSLMNDFTEVQTAFSLFFSGNLRYMPPTVPYWGYPSEGRCFYSPCSGGGTHDGHTCLCHCKLNHALRRSYHPQHQLRMIASLQGLACEV